MRNNEEATHSYKAYGLSIQTALPLPELVSAEEAPAADNGEADVVIRFGQVDGLSAEANGVNKYLHATPKGIYLSWRGVGTFLVRGGHEIVVDPAPNAEERVLRFFILGTTLAMLLHQQRELVVLHASAVGISGQAVAFVGVKYVGKSTIAAILHQRGHDLVADDILAIDLSRRSCPIVLPGFPHFRLWPDSVASLGYIPEILPQLRPELEKRGYRITTGFSQAPLPLKCIYVLNQGPELKIVSLRPNEALTALMPHWYGARFGMELLQALGLSTHFLQCAALVSKTTVCRLERPDCLSVLPDVARLVKEHLTSEL